MKHLHLAVGLVMTSFLGITAICAGCPSPSGIAEGEGEGALGEGEGEGEGAVAGEGEGEGEGAVAGEGEGEGEGQGGPRAAYYVDAGKLRDPCGSELIVRGVNKMAVFVDRSGDSFPEIAQTGANAVRFMWFSSVPASEAVQTLQRAVDNHLVPIWELHDATGDFSKMSIVSSFWSDPGTIDVLRQFEGRVIVNLANEAGSSVDDTTWLSTYTDLINNLRSAGLRMPVVVDAAGFGRNVEQLLRLAPQVQAADPLHNVVFAWHVYDGGSGQEARIDGAIATAKANQIPLMIGEFGNVTPGACGQAVPYQHLLAAAQENGIGWLPWSWDNINGDCNTGSGSPFDMVGDGVHLSTLKAGYPTEVMLSDPNSVQNTSQRTAWQINGTCQ